MLMTSFKGYYTQLKTLCEHAYTTAGNQSIHLMSVSYGTEVALGFLHRMSQDWKDKFINYFIADSPVRTCLLLFVCLPCSFFFFLFFKKQNVDV